MTPESLAREAAAQAGLNLNAPAGTCVKCGEKYQDGVNVFTPEGWAETKISRLCESCFDEIYGDEDA